MRVLVMTLCIASFCSSVFAAESAQFMSFSADSKPALSMQLPAGWSSISEAGKTDLKSPKLEVHINLFAVPNAKSVAEAVALVPEVIKGEVIELKTLETKDCTVAGSAAKLITCTGKEADDGDPSNTEVLLFSVGGKVYLVCSHGEGHDAPKARPLLVKMLDAAKLQ